MSAPPSPVRLPAGVRDFLPRAAARRLSTQFGRVLLHTLDKRGRCTTSTLWLEPGNQIISMKNGQTRTVSVTAGGTTDLEGCQ